MINLECVEIIRNHYLKYLGVTKDDIMYINDPDPSQLGVDIFWAKPTKKRNFHVLGTCGMSDYTMDTDSDIKNIELVMFLPPEWKVGDQHMEHWWPIEALWSASYTPFKTESSFDIGNIVEYTKDNKPFCSKTDYCSAVLTVPEHLPREFFELEFAPGFYIQFLCLCPITKDDLLKIKDFGIDSFIRYDLHNSAGPNMIIKKNKNN